MAGGIALPQALQLISGVPLMKVSTAFFEKLSITKRLDGGPGLQGLMSQVLKDGNLSSIMQNPMASMTQGLQAQIGNLASSLQGVTGASGLITAMTGSGGLTQALSTLQGAGDNLAGLSNGASGFFSMLAHANTVDLAGSALPSAAAMSVVTSPLTAGAFLGNIASALPPMVSRVGSGSGDVAAATDVIRGQAANALNIVTNSANALTWGANNHMLIAAVSSIAGALAVPPTFDADGYRQEGVASAFQGVLASIVQPNAATAIAASLAAQIAHTVHDAVDVAAMTSLGDD